MHYDITACCMFVAVSYSRLACWSRVYKAVALVGVAVCSMHVLPLVQC
jgi:hypothetical protein